MEQTTSHTHYTSTNPHRALMVILVLLSLAIIGGLVAGWSWYVAVLEVRARMQELGAKYDKRVVQSGGSADLAARSLGLPDPRPAEAPAPAVAPPATPARPAPPPADNSIGMVKGSKNAVSIADMVRPDSVPAAAASITAIEGEMPADLKSAVNDVMQTYWQAQSWQDKLPLVRDPASVGPRMQDFYEVQKQSDPVSGRLEGSLRFRFNGAEVVTLSYSSSRVNGKVEVAMLKDASGQWKIDWESYTGYSEMAWDQFKKTRPPESKLFRTFAGPGEYWNFEFSDEGKYLSVHMLSPDGLVSMHGYCERESSLGREVASVLSRTAGKQPLIFRLAFPDKAESDHCVRILGLVAERWLMPP